MYRIASSQVKGGFAPELDAETYKLEEKGLSPQQLGIFRYLTIDTLSLMGACTKCICCMYNNGTCLYGQRE